MGVAFNDGLIKRIASRTKKIIIGFDKDNAGIENTTKMANLFTKHNFQVQILTSDKYKDLDELLRNQGEFSYKN